MEGQAIKDLIINSIKIGYRHFDCAGIVFLLLQIWKLFYLDFNLVFQLIVLILSVADYKNEAEVGEALKEAFDTGLVKREDLFITTKVKFDQIHCEIGLHRRCIQIKS